MFSTSFMIPSADTFVNGTDFSFPNSKIKDPVSINQNIDLTTTYPFLSTILVELHYIL